MSKLQKNQQHWFDLDISQLPYWPTIPRRFTVFLLTMVFSLFLAYLFLYPLISELSTKRQSIETLQTQIIECAKTCRTSSLNQGEPNATAIVAIPSTEISKWVARLVEQANFNGLQSVSIEPESKTEDASNNGNGKSASSGLGIQKQIKVSFEGDFTNILQWVSWLSGHDFIIDVSDANLSWTEKSKIKASFLIHFLQRTD